jgi:hypothetical protein
MLVYLARRAHADETIGSFLRDWAPGLRDRIRIVPYEELERLDRIHAATYLFTDADRLNDSDHAEAERLADELASHGPEVRVLNHPRRVKRRHELLRELSKRGVNDFRALRLAELDDGLRYPVFLRRESDHDGPLTGLLHSREELEQALGVLLVRGRPLADLLAVEFLDTTDDDGIVRKYSVFAVDGELVPRHLLFDRNWYVKEPQVTDANTIAEEREFLQSNPHRAQLLELLEISGVDYGRFDYAFHAGRLQLWEVNTNPVVIMPRSWYTGDWLANQELFLQHIVPHLARLAGQPDATAIASFRMPLRPFAEPGRPAWRAIAGRVLPRPARRRIAGLLARTPPAKRLVRRRLER